MDEKKPMSLADALAGVRERQSARGRQPNGPEPMSVIMNVRAMPSQASRWRRVVEAVGYRSANAFTCDAADVYADLLEALAPAAVAAGVPPRDYVRATLMQAGAIAAPPLPTNPHPERSPYSAEEWSAALDAPSSAEEK